jgi:hypothetical protein
MGIAHVHCYEEFQCISLYLKLFLSSYGVEYVGSAHPTRLLIELDNNFYK